jgi:4-amino-4-deoxy-L-arabinose transferase-like glycosyltransferase
MTRLSEYVVRRPTLSVFAIALVIRLGAIVLGSLIPDSWIALDDATYSQLAQQMVAGESGSWSHYLWDLYWSTSTFLVPLTGLYWIFGPTEYVGQILVAAVGAGAVALTVRLAREVLEVRWALAAGAVLAVLPSQVAWSVVLLKDAWVWSATAALALVIAIALRSRGRVLVAAILGSVSLLFLLGHLRLQSSFVAAWSLVAAAVLVPRERRLAWIGGALLIAISVPWLAGGGPGGTDPVLARADNFGEARAAGAVGADSAIVAEPPSPTTDGPDATNRLVTDLSHLPRGLSVMLLEPYPWDPNRNLRVVFAKIDTILWYPILGLALVGLAQVKNHPRVLVFPTLSGAGMLMGYALAEGNLGTAFRHRGELVWIVALLATFGARSLWERHKARRIAPVGSLDHDSPRASHE